jgi:hypothetical protein
MSELPRITRGGKTYYFDARLQQLRNVDNPHDYIDLSQEETEEIRQKLQSAPKMCERCHGEIKKGEPCSETDIGSGKFTHWPTCPETKSPKQYPKHVDEVDISLREADTASGWEFVLSKGMGKNRKWFTVDYDTTNEELVRLAKEFDKEWKARVGQELEDPNHSNLAAEFEDETLGKCTYTTFFIGSELYGGYNAKCARGSMAVDYANPQEVIMRAANAKMPVHLAGDLWKKIGREGWGERVTPSEATELLKQLAAKRASGDPPGDPPPGMTYIVDGLTLKDYYDLRDLRLLLMGLEKELIGKYGIIEAEPLSSKVRDLIKEKINEINNKIEASPEHHSEPEHHSNGDDPPITKERAKVLISLMLANRVCIGYYGPGAKEARQKCVSDEYKRQFPDISKKVDEFAERDPEGFKEWLKNNFPRNLETHSNNDPPASPRLPWDPSEYAPVKRQVLPAWPEGFYVMSYYDPQHATRSDGYWQSNPIQTIKEAMNRAESFGIKQFWVYQYCKLGKFKGATQFVWNAVAKQWNTPGAVDPVDDPPVSAGKFTVRFNEGSPNQEDIEVEAPSREGATIEAARTYSIEHSGAYPTTARVISPAAPSLAQESWQRRVTGSEERPPF